MEIYFFFKYLQGPDNNDEYSAVIRANNPIPSQCRLFYFEVDIIDIGENGYVVRQIFLYYKLNQFS